MSKYWPPILDDIIDEQTDKYSINGKEISIYKVLNGESLMFKMNNLVFEIHKMGTIKNTQIMKVVVWIIKDKFIKHNMSGDGQSITSKNWKFYVKTNNLVYMHDRSELVKLAINCLDDYEKEIVKGIFY